MEYSPPRPLFVYGTLCAKPLLAWALTGDASNTAAVANLTVPGKVYGYERYLVLGCDHPAAVESADKSSSIDGLLICLENESQRKKLHDFEGDSYDAELVSVTLDNGVIVDADMYVWVEKRDQLSTEAWDLSKFEKERLQDWLDLFEGMVLVGDVPPNTWEK